MKKIARFVFCAVCIACSTGSVHGQTVPNQVTPNNATGIMPYNTYGGVRENINLATGDLNLRIPIVSFPGRNGHNFDLAIIYDSKIWDVHNVGNPDIDDFFVWSHDNLGPSPRLNIPKLDYTPTWITTNTLLCDTNFIFISEDGAKHPFTIGKGNGNMANCYTYPKTGPLVGTPCPSCAITQGDAVDASFIHLNTTNYPTDSVIYLKDGERLHFANVAAGTATITLMEDTNGNIVNFSSSGPLTITDTINRQITFATGISFKDSNGVSQAVTLGYTTETLAPTFSPIEGMNWDPPPANVGMLTSITLPNGRGYTFQYNTYGEVTKITYPTGGYTRYDYAAFTAGVIGVPVDFREVTAKHVCADPAGGCTTSTEITTTYTPTIGGGINQYVDVQEPRGRLTHYQFGTSIAAFSTRELSRTINDNGTALRSTTTTYNNLDASGNLTGTSLPISKTTSLLDVTPNLLTKTTWAYDSIGGKTIDNVTNESEYGYGTGSAGSLIRQTVRTFLHTNSVNATDYTANGIHILDRKLTENVEDASSSVLAKIQYEYDNYGSISSSGAVQHDTAFGTSYKIRGNITKFSRWRNTDGAWLATTHSYDDAGNVLVTTDPKLNSTTLSYADAWGDTHCAPTGSSAAYVTSVTNAASQSTQYTYNSCTGTMATSKDANLRITSFGYDALSRLASTSFPDSGQISYCFSDTTTSSCYSAGQIFMTRTDKITSSLNKAQKVLVDGIGNVIQTQLTSDPEGTDYTDVSYDSLERRLTVSNPHRSAPSSTDGTTTYSYDALDRVKTLTQPDGSTIATTFSSISTPTISYCKTVTDEAGKARKSCSDGLGRMTSVWEDPSVLNYESDYQYSVLDKLLTVNQKGGSANSANWRTRTFTYNSLAQLLIATNPESGTISYSYDPNGNLLTKVSPAPNQTNPAVTATISYCYDSLNRLTAKAYSLSATCASPVASYFYDQTSYNGLTIANGFGERTGMADASGATAWTYDVLGRPLTEQRKINGSTAITESTSYTYNLDGSLLTLTYPTGRIITYTPGAAGRMLSAVEAAHSLNYVTIATYAPPGELGTFANGASISSAETYNSRLQPLQLYYTAGTISPTTLGQLQAAPCPTTPATIMSRSYNFGAGTNDNGNVDNIIDCLVTNRTQSFDYDRLNRIQDAHTTGTGTTATNWGETYTIDPWGNLTHIAVYPGQTNFETLSVSANVTNQLTGFGYDAAGNMTSNSPGTYTYDAENRLVATPSAGFTYVYDGDGQRVIKCAGTYPTCSAGTLYWKGIGTDTLDETSWTGTQSEEYIFFNGRRVARRDGTGNTVHYYLADHLGSADVIASSVGGINKTTAFYPFGGEISVTGPSFVQNYKFTGKERDSESGLDMFGARYYGSSLGRFMSTDAKQVTVRHLSLPQKWNKYAYVQNNPLANIDPDGLDDYKVFIGDTHTGGDWGRAQAAAEAHGHTFQIFRGKDASIENFNRALSGASNRVIFVGHTTHDPTTETTNAVELGNGRSAGAQSEKKEVLPTDTPGAPPFVTDISQPETTVNADTVGIFGCNSIDLSSGFGDTNFVGVDSGSNNVTSLEALGSAASAFVQADAATRPANGSPVLPAQEPITAANTALDDNKHQEDLDGDEVKRSQ